ncbi:hypothetical protein LXA43DRAFT_1099523 [Ganoderma leucocontextum]|nr:hypothetical protein LXA43DRAFT_1099523 [Ganoderma leucocontextum]
MPDSELDTDVVEAICGSIDDIRDLLSLSLASPPPHITSVLSSSQTAWITDKTARPDHDVEKIMEILDCAVNLDSLDLSLDPSYAATPRVSSTFATIRALRHPSLTKPLRSWDTCWTHHALMALRSPLVTLRVRAKDWTSDPPSSISQQLRSVRSLTIAKHLPREPKLDALLYLFPSLDDTLFLRLDFWKSLTLSSDLEKLAEIREENRRAQETSRWTRLDRLDCEYMTAEMLALQCPIRHLTVDPFGTFILDCIQPRHLVIDSIRLPFYRDISLYQGYTSSSVHGFCTTHVVLIVSCEAEEYEAIKKTFDETDDIGWKTVLVSPPSNLPTHHAASTTPAHLTRARFVFISALCPAWHPQKDTIRALSVFPHATHVRLVFHCYTDRPCGEELDDFVCKMRDASASGDPPPQVLAACPALRCFILTVAGRDETKPDAALQIRALRVVDAREGQLGNSRGGGGAKGKSGKRASTRTFEELSDYEARKVIGDEDMGLPEAWERKLEACRTWQPDPL